MVKIPLFWKLVILGACWPAAVLAEPMVQMTQGDVRIVVYTEDCALKNIVSNLPKRAVWTEKGKSFEGCAGSNPDFGIILFYFKEDKTVAAVPMQNFVRVNTI